MATIEEIKRVKEMHEVGLMKKAGVLGCAVGYKQVGGKKTGKLSIVCYVKKKKPEGELRKEDVIPEEIDGTPTDVVESGEIRAM